MSIASALIMVKSAAECKQRLLEYGNALAQSESIPKELNVPLVLTKDQTVTEEHTHAIVIDLLYSLLEQAKPSARVTALKETTCWSQYNHYHQRDTEINEVTEPLSPEVRLTTQVDVDAIVDDEGEEEEDSKKTMPIEPIYVKKEPNSDDNMDSSGDWVDPPKQKNKLTRLSRMPSPTPTDDTVAKETQQTTTPKPQSDGDEDEDDVDDRDDIDKELDKMSREDLVKMLKMKGGSKAIARYDMVVGDSEDTDKDKTDKKRKRNGSPSQHVKKQKGTSKAVKTNTTDSDKDS
ncbi:hypothetical protein SAMD00019534_021580 [Acytostelium subglobosum LB1]|uniref:hypothetical protein n=1 Tax=Acytostelium subglobosum LB1 TaxID=1410327 RepID=UPI0006450146|nr:hypothetical protein SAMD00019534_021580 [Acytostelium subglobosum LB1]GAM18983.1 hypothetical protein SAMD00019534_021580 [Acytostelium subglobosum LB1]|eukprot:XP_012756910.1 hypothetical protein SAMD00019534_021580 [Acytostelium subglobosum LB1]